MLDQLQHASTYGINAPVSGVDMDVAGARRDQVVSQLHRGVEFLLKKNKVAVVRGRGRLNGRGRVTVTPAAGDAPETGASALVIAPGSPVTDVPGVPAYRPHVRP